MSNIRDFIIIIIILFCLGARENASQKYKDLRAPTIRSNHYVTHHYFKENAKNVSENKHNKSE